MKKLITFIFACTLILSAHAQGIDGDALMSIIGTRVDASATQKFLNDYGIKNTSGAKYSSVKFGLDLNTQKDTIISMTIYRSNSIYGSFSAKLPKNISFGSSSAEVVRVLGKPTTSYMNSGYSEYEYGKYVMTCWFEQGILSQVALSLK